MHRPLLQPLESRRLLAAGFQVELDFDSSVTSDVQTLVQAAANRWQQIIVGDLPDVGSGAWGGPVDDIRINVSEVAIDGVGGGVAQTKPTYIRTDSQLPIAAVMQIDVADVSIQEAGGVMDDIVTHEMAHAFGFGTTWKQYPGITSGTGGSNPLFLGANALREYRNLIGDQSAAGVPLDSTSGTGTRDTHWSETVLKNEILTGFINPGANPISRVTVGQFADLGYTVNYVTADAFSLGTVVTPPITPSPAALSGTVFTDTDRDGSFDSNESGVGGRTVFADANFNGTLDSGEVSATTASNGSFTLSNLSAGSYAIKQVVPSGLIQTTPTSANGFGVTLVAGQSASGYLFGTMTPVPVVTPPSTDPSNAAISGLLFNDYDGDGRKDKDEPALNNQTVYIDLDNDGSFDQGTEPFAKSNSSGQYTISGLAAGTYTVRQVLQTNWSQTTPKSNATHIVTLAKSASVTNAHFGSRAPPSATLGGKLWDDANHNGRQDKGEANLSGRTLWLDLDDDAKQDSGEPTAKTNSKGEYRFTSLSPRAYTVRQVLPKGWTQTTPAKGKPWRVTPAVGQSITNLHFGSYKSSKTAKASSIANAAALVAVTSDDAVKRKSIVTFADLV